MLLSTWDTMILLQMLLAVALGSLLGLERELRRHPAGLRTHILVTLGSCVFMILAYRILSHPWEGSGDPTRLAAGVVTGIGFLGAGAIMKEGVNVKGLTTAASIWLAAGVGISVGAGEVFLAVGSTFIGVAVLVLLNRAEMRLRTKRVAGTLTVKGQSMIGIPPIVDTVLENRGAVVESFDIHRSRGRVKVVYRIELPVGQSRTELLKELASHPELEDIIWE